MDKNADPKAVKAIVATTRKVITSQVKEAIKKLRETQKNKTDRRHSSMDKVQQIKAEIKRLKETASIGLSEYEAGHENGIVKTCNSILTFIDFLDDKPSEGLEAAAEDWEEDECSCCDYIGAVKAKQGFKAGAQWQKEQLLKDAVDAEITKRVDGTLGVCVYLDRGSGFKFGDKVKLIIVKKQ